MLPLELDCSSFLPDVDRSILRPDLDRVIFPLLDAVRSILRPDLDRVIFPLLDAVRSILRLDPDCSGCLPDAVRGMLRLDPDRDTPRLDAVRDMLRPESDLDRALSSTSDLDRALSSSSDQSTLNSSPEIVGLVVFTLSRMRFALLSNWVRCIGSKVLKSSTLWVRSIASILSQRSEMVESILPFIPMIEERSSARFSCLSLFFGTKNTILPGFRKGRRIIKCCLVSQLVLGTMNTKVNGCSLRSVIRNGIELERITTVCLTKLNLNKIRRC